MQTFITRKHFIYTVSNSRDCITNSQRGSVLALALWRYLCCLHAAVCEMRRFKLLFRINAKCICKETTPVYCWGQALSLVCVLYSLYCLFAALSLIQCNYMVETSAHNCPFPGGSTPPRGTWFLWPICVIVLNCILIESAISQKLTVFSAYILPWTRYVPPKFSLSLGGCRPVSHCFIDPCMHDPVNAARKVSVTQSCHCQHM